MQKAGPGFNSVTRRKHHIKPWLGAPASERFRIVLGGVWSSRLLSNVLTRQRGELNHAGRTIVTLPGRTYNRTW